MKQDDYETKVIFRKFNNARVGGQGWEIIAIFPELPGDYNPSRTCESYIHTGQHGACALDYPSFTKPAKPEEYEELKQELESLGYVLKVGKKRTRLDDKKRHAYFEEN